MQYGGLQSDFDNLRAQLDEELEGSSALKSQLQKSQAEYQTLKSKYDKDVSARADELDELRFVSPSLVSQSRIRFSTRVDTWVLAIWQIDLRAETRRRQRLETSWYLSKLLTKWLGFPFLCDIDAF